MKKADRATHSDQGEDVIHVWPDVNLHKGHNHSHLLEEELQENRVKHYTSSVRKKKKCF